MMLFMLALAASSQQAGGGATIRMGPHSRVGVPTRRVDHFECSGMLIQIDMRISMSFEGRRTSRVSAILIDGRQASDASLASVNALLEGFENEPAISTICLGRRVSLLVADVERAQVSQRRGTMLPISIR